MRYPQSRIPSILAPLFWITATYLTMTFVPILFDRLSGNIDNEQLSALAIQRAPAPIRTILGKQTLDISGSQPSDDRILSASSDGNSSSFSLPAPPSSPQDISRYVQDVVERVTKEVVERSTKEVTETKQEVTTSVCRQIVTSIEERCGISTSR